MDQAERIRELEAVLMDVPNYIDNWGWVDKHRDILAALGHAQAIAFQGRAKEGRPSEAGAPGIEVEVTPDMIRAGEHELLMRMGSAETGCPYSEVVEAVFRKMMAVWINSGAI